MNHRNKLNAENLEFEKMTPVIKKLLKERHITYRQLAKKLQMSESGVKKIFASKDCSLLRLNQICSVINIPLSEIFDGKNQSNL